MEQVFYPNYVWGTLLAIGLLLISAVMRKHMAYNRIIVWFNMLWAVVLLLIGTDMVRYDQASMVAWVTLFTGLFAVNIGGMLGMRPRRSGGPAPSMGPRGIVLANRTQFLVMLAIYAVGFAEYLHTIQALFGLHTLLSNPEQIRAAPGISYLAAVPLWARLAMYPAPILVALIGLPSSMENPLPRLTRWAILAALAVSQLALLQRTNLFLGLLLLLAAYLTKPREKHHAQQRGSRSQRFVAAALLAVVLLAVFQFLGSALGKTGTQAERSGNVAPALTSSGLTSPFVYLTSGTAAFLALTDSTNHQPLPEVPTGQEVFGNYNPQTWGGATFALVLKAVPVVPPFASTSPFIDVGVVTNVYTWFEPFYRDFRVPGVALGGALLGFGLTLLYRHRLRSSRLFWLQALAVSTMFLSPFVAKQQSTPVVVEALIIVALTRRARVSEAAPERVEVGV